MEVNKKLLCQLEDMGFPLARATRALHHSGNSSLEAAIDWIVDHENEPEINHSPLVPVKIEIKGSESSSMSEGVKLKAQKLRDKAQKRYEEEEHKLEWGREKVERRGVPLESDASLRSVTPMMQKNKEILPVMSTEIRVNPAAKGNLMRDCLRSLRRNNKDDDLKVKRAFHTLLIYVRNVARNPDEEKFRRIRISNPAFNERVGAFKEGIKFLELCGFERIEGGMYLYLRKDKIEMATIRSAAIELQSAITNPFFGLVSK